MIKTKSRTPLESLESFLTARGVLKPPQLQKVHRFMLENETNIGTAIQYCGIASGKELGDLLGIHFGVQRLPRNRIAVPAIMKGVLSREKAKRLQVFPLNYVEESGQKILLLAMTDPLDSAVVATVEQICHLKVQPVYVTLEELQNLYVKYYGGGLDFLPAEITSYNEEIAKDRMAPLEKGAPPVPTQKDPRWDALLGLMVKKKVFTLQEFQDELEKVCS